MRQRARRTASSAQRPQSRVKQQNLSCWAAKSI